MAEIVQLPENGGSNGNLPFSIPIGGGNGLFGNGSSSIVDLFGFAIIASMFGWGNGGGFGGNRGTNNTEFLSAQISNDTGRQLVMQAITAQGEQSRQAIQTLSTMLGQDFNTVNNGVQNVVNTLNGLANAQGVGFMQVVNSIQSGNAAIISQFQQCCCQNQLENARNTAALQQSIGDVKGAIGAMGADNKLAICQQTNSLSTQAERNTNSLLQAINAQTIAMNDQFCALKEREMQAKIDTQAEIITQLRGQQDNAAQTNQIMAFVNAQIAPLQAKINDIAAKQLPTVPVQYPNITAVNTTPYTGGGMYGSVAPTFNF